MLIKNIRLLIKCIVFCTIFFGCESETLKNVYRQEIDGFIIELKKVKTTDIDSLGIDSKSEEVVNYIFSIKNKNGQSDPIKVVSASSEEMTQKFDYLNFQAQKDFGLVLDSNNKASCVLYHFEKTYGVSPDFHFNLCFLVPKGAVGKGDFEYFDNVFGLGIVKFKL
jgi:hypothetical protein